MTTSLCEHLEEMGNMSVFADNVMIAITTYDENEVSSVCLSYPEAKTLMKALNRIIRKFDDEE